MEIKPWYETRTQISEYIAEKIKTCTYEEAFNLVDSAMSAIWLPFYDAAEKGEYRFNRLQELLWGLKCVVSGQAKHLLPDLKS